MHWTVQFEQLSSQNYLGLIISTLTQLRLTRCKFSLQNNTPQTLNEPTNNSKTYQNITANDSPRLSVSALSKTSQRTGQPADKSTFLNNGRAMFGGHQRASTRRSNSNFLAEVIMLKLIWYFCNNISAHIGWWQWLEWNGAITCKYTHFPCLPSTNNKTYSHAPPQIIPTQTRTTIQSANS